MMVVGIGGSPRKAGNTEFLLNEALAVAKERGFETERLLISEMKVDFCNDCGDCSKGKSCPKEDDMERILTALQKADGIIVASPVYFGSVTAQLKAVFDRTIPLRGRAFVSKTRSAVPSALGVQETAARRRHWRLCTPGCIFTA
jgi:multimeric flavodoxin WrbA